jgi:hypothetical protein
LAVFARASIPAGDAAPDSPATMPSSASARIALQAASSPTLM